MCQVECAPFPEYLARRLVKLCGHMIDRQLYMSISYPSLQSKAIKVRGGNGWIRMEELRNMVARVVG